MNGFQRLSPDTLRIERVLDAPPETVWRWLTEPELRRQWLAGGTAAAGKGEFDLVFDHDRLSDDDVPYPPEYAKWKGATSHEHVLRSEVPRLLVWTWSGGKEGQITFELTPVGHQQTRLVLTHSGISGPPAMWNFGGGWLSHLEVLEARLAGRPVPDFWSLHLQATRQVSRSLGPT